jgi:hypothetical protein
MIRRSPIAAVAVLSISGLLAAPAFAQSLVTTTGVVADACTEPSQTGCNRGILYLVNGDTLQVDATIDLWRGRADVFVRKIVVHPGGTLAYVAQGIGTSMSGWIDVIDLRTRTRVMTYAVTGNLRTISPDGTVLYLVTATAVLVINTATGDVVSTIPANSPADVAVARNSNRLYVAGGTFQSFSIALFDRSNGALLQDIPLPRFAGKIELTPDETHLYALAATSRIFDIDTASNTIAGTITDFGGPTSPNDFAFARGRAYVSVSKQSPGIGAGEVIAVIDIATRELVATVPTVDPVFVEASSDGARVWTHVLGEPRVITIDTATNQIIGRVSTPGGPGELVAVPTQRTTSLMIDRPSAATRVLQPVYVSGWAVDVVSALPGPGVSTVHVWAFPANGGSPTFVGADYGRPRPDIGALFGSSYTNSGYQVMVRGLTPGPYELRASGYSTRTGGFSMVAAVPVTIVSGAQLVVDAPRNGSSVTRRFDLVGWALDGAALVGTGVDAVHVWAYPISGGPPMFAGAAMIGDPRPDLAALFGAQFANVGYHLSVSSLPPDTYTLVVYAHSSVTGTFNVEQQLRVTVPPPSPLMYVDTPSANAQIGTTFRIAGWAAEFYAPSGTGVDIIHVWATTPSGAATFLGAATYGLDRPDVGAWLGPEYRPSGFALDASLPPGTYAISVYARSTTTGTFRTVRVVPVVVQPLSVASTRLRP